MLVPHSNSSVVFTLPPSPFKTHSNEYLSPYVHRPARVVKLAFAYNWQTSTETTTNPKNPSNNHHAQPVTDNNFTPPYVGVLGHFIGVLDILATPELSIDPDFSDEATQLFNSSISQLSENSMNHFCVSRSVDDIPPDFCLVFSNNSLILLMYNRYVGKAYLFGQINTKPKSNST